MRVDPPAAAVLGVLAAASISLAAPPSRAATLQVGPGRPFTTLATAIAAAQDGDTIAVQSGTYTNDFAEIRTRLTLTAVGGRVTLRATQDIPNNKGILVVDTDLTITGFTFVGARVPAWAGSNGAGIRLQGGNLTVRNCLFQNNQEGILGGFDPAETVTITGSEFARNGVATGPAAGYEHNIYIGGAKLLQIDNSYFHDARVGHEIKSRALATTITNSRVADGATGTASYSIDLPNGGVVSIANTIVQQGPLSQNATMIAYGEEGAVPAGSTLSLQNVTLVNDLVLSPPLGVWNAAGAPASAANTTVWGITDAQLALGPIAWSGTVRPAVRPLVPTGRPWLR